MPIAPYSEVKDEKQMVFARSGLDFACRAIWVRLAQPHDQYSLRGNRSDLRVLERVVGWSDDHFCLPRKPARL